MGKTQLALTDTVGVEVIRISLWHIHAMPKGSLELDLMVKDHLREEEVGEKRQKTENLWGGGKNGRI